MFVLDVLEGRPCLLESQQADSTLTLQYIYIYIYIIYIYGVQPCAYLTPCYDELRLGNKVKDHTASVTNKQKKRRK